MRSSIVLIALFAALCNFSNAELGMDKIEVQVGRSFGLLKQVESKITKDPRPLAIISLTFDRSMTPEQKFAKCGEIKDANGNTPTKEKLEKNKAALLDFFGKVDKIFAYYDKEIVPIISPKAKRFFDGVFEIGKKPGDFIKLSAEDMMKKYKDLTKDFEDEDGVDVFMGFGLLLGETREAMMKFAKLIAHH
ncbi:hypothetical protein WR25_09406 [Diploscapter pachys]|uniref:Uncharacterized protein n=1 Tax=Diploscapter pachys TaxID=2018661 RepID=A0A2A2M275_9BILA|nr:hypothetical protein WR25_09406 [Diploscapter pachys]